MTNKHRYIKRFSLTMVMALCLSLAISATDVHTIDFIPDQQVPAILEPLSQGSHEELAAAQEVLQTHGVYTVGYSPDHSPFSYVTSAGNVDGMGIDMMDYIAELAGIQVEYVPLTDGQPVDISLSILDADQRTENSLRSDPYFNFQMMLTGQEESFGVLDAKIGHLNYSAIDDGMIEQALPGSTAYAYNSYANMEQALKSGDIDYILTSSLVVTQTDALSQSLGAYSLSTEITLDVMLKYNENLTPEITDALNTVIGHLDEQTTYSIMINAAVVAAAEEMTTADFIYQHRFEIACVFLGMVSILLAVMLHYRANRRKILLRGLYVDDLTGLMTERKFFEVVRSKLKKAKVPYYIISIDIDNFKYINENYSYAKGTQTILAFAQMLENSFESAECIARAFGDNFLILTKVKPRPHNVCGRDNCQNCMDNCLTHILGPDYKMMTSAGIYVIQPHTNAHKQSLSYMVDCANIARRRGKDAYSRTEIFFTEEIESELRAKNDIIASMEQAIVHREFRMHYQPKIDFQTNQVIGAEALVRWYTPNGNQVYPNQFIYLFEQNGFITRLDFYVLNEVCHFLNTHPEMPKISVNLSGFSFLDPNLVNSIMSILNRNQISPSCIEIEITETAIVNEFDIIVKKIDALKACGFTISMDDFGVGMSSLHRLKDISIDVLKIDKEFLGNEALSKKGISIIDSIIRMSRRIEVTTVAEGVETQEQVQLLSNLNCNIAQGYYYSKPLTEEDFVAFMSQERPYPDAQ